MSRFSDCVREIAEVPRRAEASVVGVEQGLEVAMHEQ